MNILHLCPDFNYADGRSYYVFLLLKYLNRNGHNVFLYTNDGDSFERLNDEKISFFTHKQLSSRTSFIKSVSLISGFVKKNNIDIIHSHHRYYELIAGAVSSFNRNKIKTVFTALSIVEKRYGIEYRSDKIIAVSNSVKQMLIEKFKINESRIVSISNFADSEEIDTINTYNQEKQQNSKNQIELLAIGRFHKDKDFATLLNAIRNLKNNNIHLNLIGEGPEETLYKKLISKYSLKAELISPKKNLKKYFQNADICILPSIIDPFPGFMLQSGLYNKPFIGSDVDGISELIVNGNNGLLFMRQDQDDLSLKIREFINNSELAKKCAENLHFEVTGKYTEKTIIPLIEKVYHNLKIDIIKP
ncbi:MAG: glycosyltransferase family 4 protein [Ignavibacteria bacterium]